MLVFSLCYFIISQSDLSNKFLSEEPQRKIFQNVKFLPSYCFLLDGRMFYPGFRLDLSVIGVGDMSDIKTIHFLFKDAATFGKTMTIQRPIGLNDQITYNKELGITTIGLADSFLSPSGKRPKGNVLPLGVYYIEALVHSGQGFKMIARSKPIAIVEP